MEEASAPIVTLHRNADPGPCSSAPDPPSRLDEIPALCNDRLGDDVGDGGEPRASPWVVRQLDEEVPFEFNAEIDLAEAAHDPSIAGA